MNKKLKKIFLIIPLAGSLYSCFLPNSDIYGQLYFKVNFPEKSFNLKAIPQNTEKINISIVHGGASKKTDNYVLSRNEPTLYIVSIEEGNKEVTAKAVDLNNNVIAEAKNDIVIKPLRKNILELELIPLRNDVIIEPSESPSPTPSPTVSNSNSTQTGSNNSPAPIPSDNNSSAPTPTPTPTPEQNSNSSNNETITQGETKVEINVKPDDIGVK